MTARLQPKLLAQKFITPSGYPTQIIVLSQSARTRCNCQTFTLQLSETTGELSLKDTNQLILST